MDEKSNNIYNQEAHNTARMAKNNGWLVILDDADEFVQNG